MRLALHRPVLVIVFVLTALNGCSSRHVADAPVVEVRTTSTTSPIQQSVTEDAFVRLLDAATALTDCVRTAAPCDPQISTLTAAGRLADQLATDDLRVAAVAGPDGTTLVDELAALFDLGTPLTQAESDNDACSGSSATCGEKATALRQIAERTADDTFAALAPVCTRPDPSRVTVCHLDQ